MVRGLTYKNSFGIDCYTVIETQPDTATIRAKLQPDSMWGPVDYVRCTGSTNADLSAEAHAGGVPGHVLLAGEQTAGRGRLARTWVTPPDSAVAMSMLLAPTQPMERWGWLSLLAGLAVAEALAELAPKNVDVMLKWPNDVLVDGGKVCGILSERVEGTDGARAVVGLGINLTLQKEQLPVPTANSLLLAGFETSATDVVSGVLRHFERYYRQWESTGTLRDEYRAACGSIGAELTIASHGTDPIPGVGHDVDHDGRLEVRTSRGVEAFAVGDVVHARLA